MVFHFLRFGIDSFCQEIKAGSVLYMSYAGVSSMGHAFIISLVCHIIFSAVNVLHWDWNIPRANIYNGAGTRKPSTEGETWCDWEGLATPPKSVVVDFWKVLPMVGVEAGSAAVVKVVLYVVFNLLSTILSILIFIVPSNVDTPITLYFYVCRW